MFQKVSSLPIVTFGSLSRVSVRPLEEKSDLLRSWIASKENMDATECSLIVSKKQASEVETGRELLTIREMVAKGFSE